MLVYQVSYQRSEARERAPQERRQKKEVDVGGQIHAMVPLQGGPTAFEKPGRAGPVGSREGQDGVQRLFVVDLVSARQPERRQSVNGGASMGWED
ncbi:MAG: hypothetical protein L0387_34615 [Acidobacteria bacterium]|nr:hypothetical protein [Acidobacteriota bacterium]